MTLVSDISIIFPVLSITCITVLTILRHIFVFLLGYLFKCAITSSNDINFETFLLKCNVHTEKCT